MNEQDQEQKTKVTVQIYGDDYTIKGSGNADYITKLAAYVDKKMRLIGNKNPQLAMNKIAVLAALNLAEELSKLQDDYDSMVKLFEEENALK